MARNNLYIKTGTYSGTGVAANITGLGFRPDLVIIKAAGGTPQNAVWRTKIMRGDSSGFLTSSNGGLSNYVKEILNDGFQVGTTNNVNGNGFTYYYIALKGMSSQKYFYVGNYFGDGNDSRNFVSGGFSFTPDLVISQRVSTTQTYFSTSLIGTDNTLRFDGATQTADVIQNLQSNGFQLGTSTGINASGIEYFFAAMKQYPGVMAVGKYLGTGAAQSISGVGFKPDVVIVKNSATADQARMLTTEMVVAGINSVFMGTTAVDANGITSLDSDGFTVGTGNSVNRSGDNVYWIALKSGNFSVPIGRSTI